MHHFPSTCEGRRHREGLVGASSRIFDLLRRAVPAASCAARADGCWRDYIGQAQGRLLAGQLRLDWRHLRRRHPHADQRDPRAGDRRARWIAKMHSSTTDNVFGFAVPTSVPGIDTTLLYPERTWGRQEGVR